LSEAEAVHGAFCYPRQGGLIWGHFVILDKEA
jgi:hypothetical protein